MCVHSYLFSIIPGNFLLPEQFLHSCAWDLLVLVFQSRIYTHEIVKAINSTFSPCTHTYRHFLNYSELDPKIHKVCCHARQFRV